MAKRPKLSGAAKTALINIGTLRQGATLRPGTAEDVRLELADAGLVGRVNGLTRAGSIERQRLVSEGIDQL